MSKDIPNMESNFVALRLEAGLTQRDIADGLGVSEQTVRNWEQGKHPPRLTIPQVKKLCHLLKKSLDELPDNFGPPVDSTPMAAESPGDYPKK
jgi:transcriptional regulator with XRE-family HTH domain